jgi:plasmid stabilization system protein ParE
MKRKLIARPRAELDVIKHFVYLTEQNPQLAARFKQSVKAAFSSIAKSPASCATVQFLSLPAVELRFKRPQGFKNYLIYFQVSDDSIFILRVLHASQNAESELRP